VGSCRASVESAAGLGLADAPLDRRLAILDDWPHQMKTVKRKPKGGQAIH
jgi:Ni,Fe-hydrogenase III component G